MSRALIRRDSMFIRWVFLVGMRRNLVRGLLNMALATGLGGRICVIFRFFAMIIIPWLLRTPRAVIDVFVHMRYIDGDVKFVYKKSPR